MMDKKYIYARENLKPLILIWLIIGMPLLIFSIYMLISDSEVKVVGYCGLAGVFILFVIELIFLIRNLKWRKRHRQIEESGIRVTGYVHDFGYKFEPGNLRTDTPDTEKHWLIIKYRDLYGQEKTFATPYLSFVPEKDTNITCDVFLTQEDAFAANFRNLRKKKFKWMELFLSILAILVITGIILLVAYFKRHG